MRNSTVKGEDTLLVSCIHLALGLVIVTRSGGARTRARGSAHAGIARGGSWGGTACSGGHSEARGGGSTHGGGSGGAHAGGARGRSVRGWGGACGGGSARSGGSVRGGGSGGAQRGVDPVSGILPLPVVNTGVGYHARQRRKHR